MFMLSQLHAVEVNSDRGSKFAELQFLTLIISGFFGFL